MFEDLQKLFRNSLAAFRSEYSRREPEDQVAELLSAMRGELVAARAALPEFEREVQRARAELAREREALELCERRGGMAERIGDAETVRVAAGFAARHRERITVLEKKVSAAEAEWSLRRREAEEMKTRYQEADVNRFALVARLRQQSASQRMGSVLGEEGAFGDFERMSDAVDRNASITDAAEELDRRDAPGGGEQGVEERLRELKRRMGKEA